MRIRAARHGACFFVPEPIGDLIEFTSLTDVLRQGADETIDSIVATAPTV